MFARVIVIVLDSVGIGELPDAALYQDQGSNTLGNIAAAVPLHIPNLAAMGLSKLVTESRNSLSFGRGTPYYMAPEMLQRVGDARSDVYSLGVILYECLTGDVPFKGDSEWQVLRKHETATPEFPPHSIGADREIILRCLAKQPADRFASVADLLRALQAPVALGESLHWSGTASPASEPGAVEPPPLPYELPLRDAAESPYGMPWQRSSQGSGLVEWIVRMIFTAFEAVIFVVLLPVRAVSTFAGRGVTWLFQLPFKVFGFLLRLVGLLVIAGLVLLAVVVLLNVFRAL